MTGLKDVHSEESERALVFSPIDSDIAPLEKPNIRGKRQVRSLTQRLTTDWIEFGAGSGAMNALNRNRTFHIEYCRRLHAGARQEEMKESVRESLPKRLLGIEPSGNGNGSRTATWEGAGER